MDVHHRGEESGLAADRFRRKGRSVVEINRVLSSNPLAFIQRCVRESRKIWTYHVNMRLRIKEISRKSIMDSVNTYEIIESYPEDKYLPSYLIYTEYEEEYYHILFATDVEDENVRIVTTYRPSALEWSADLKTRRESS